MPPNPDVIPANIASVRRTVNETAERAGRDPASVAVLAVGKKHPADALRAAARAGQRDFGGNYLQEALAKMEQLADLPLVWHFIGAIQSNKTRAIAERFDWVHTVDREKIARRLNDQRPDDARPLNICLQVNISGEAQKAGARPADVSPLAEAVRRLPRLKLRGLMTLPAPSRDAGAQHEPFAELARLFEQLRGAGYPLDTLSMGMSGDYEAAIAEGATIVRIGSAIFGPR
jgi:pyridoxal phosphate enzyme (YggS family)